MTRPRWVRAPPPFCRCRLFALLTMAAAAARPGRVRRLRRQFGSGCPGRRRHACGHAAHGRAWSGTAFCRCRRAGWARQRPIRRFGQPRRRWSAGRCRMLRSGEGGPLRRVPADTVPHDNLAIWTNDDTPTDPPPTPTQPYSSAAAGVVSRPRWIFWPSWNSGPHSVVACSTWTPHPLTCRTTTSRIRR